MTLCIECGVNLNGSSGDVSSPNYPNNYYNSLTNCFWLITVATNKLVLLTFHDFYTEYRVDFVPVSTPVLLFYYLIKLSIFIFVCNKRTKYSSKEQLVGPHIHHQCYQIWDGDSSRSQLIAMPSGNGIPAYGPFITSGYQMLVGMTSSSSMSYRGFHATYTQIGKAMQLLIVILYLRAM